MSVMESGEVKPQIVDQIRRGFVRILAIGTLLAALVYGAVQRDSLWHGDWRQRLNMLMKPEGKWYADLPGLSYFDPGWPSLLLLIIYFAATAWLGWKVLEQLLSRSAPDTHWVVRLSAGFIPGYLVVGAWNRIVGAFLPNSLSAYFSLAGVLIAASYLLARKSAQFLQWKNLRKNIRASWALDALLVACAIFYALVDGIMINGHGLSGDGSDRFVRYLHQQTIEPQPSAYMPWADQHYDEFAFLHPISWVLADASFPVLALFWILSSAGRLSSLGLVYFLAKAGGLNGPFAFLTAIFLWLGTTAAYPVDYLIAFDSHNPLFYTVHIGRIAASLMPILAWLAALQKPGPNQLLPQPARSLLLFLLGFGVTALNIHAAILAGLCALVAISILKPDAVDPIKGVRWLLPLLPWIGFLSFIHVPSQPVIVFVLLAILAASASLMLWVRKPRSHPALRLLGTGWLIGALLGGNMICALIWKLTGVGPAHWIPSRALLGDSSFPFVIGQYLPTPRAFLSSFQRSGWEFLRHFAVPFALYALCWTETKLLRRDRAALLLSLGLFFSGLVLVLYMQIGINPWFLTRLYEPPYYALLFFALIKLFQAKSRRLLITVSAWVLLYTFPVFFTSNRPAQWQLNFEHSYRVLWSRLF